MTNRQQDNFEETGLKAADVRRIADIVLGTGLNWDGVVKEIQKVQESLTSQMKSMEQRSDVRFQSLEEKIGHLEDKIGLVPTGNYDRRLLLAIMVSVVFLAAVVAWGVYVLANGGAV